MESVASKEGPGKNFEPITWSCMEYEHTNKNSEWFWALGLIGVAGAVASLMFENILFAVFILIAVFVLAIFAARKPEEVTFTLTQRGVRIQDKLHPYKSLKAFGIDEVENHVPKLIFESNKIFVLDIIIPLKDVDLHEVHDYLLDFLPEEDLEEPLTHKIMEWLGF